MLAWARIRVEGVQAALDQKYPGVNDCGGDASENVFFDVGNPIYQRQFYGIKTKILQALGQLSVLQLQRRKTTVGLGKCSSDKLC